MDRILFLKFLENLDLDKFNWYREMFSIPLKEVNEYYTFNNNEVTFSDGSKVTLTKTRLTPLQLNDVVTLEVSDLPNLTYSGDYKLGDIILNYLLGSRPFGDKILFTPDISIDMVEDFISYNLGKTVTVSEMESFVESGDLLKQFADLFVVSSTDKSIAPAKGIKEYKAQLFKEYEEKYGPSLYTDIKYIVEIEKKLEDYDREYMKDDPTYGILLDDKIMGNARKNLFGTMGAEIGMDGNMTPIIKNSLVEGYPNDNKQFSSLVNSSRKGSIMRGHNTQNTGADAKVTARVLNSITIIDNDCKTKDTTPVLLTNDNYKDYIGFYTMESGKPLLLTDKNIEEFIDKTIGIRTYLGCKQENFNYCSICSGELGKDNPKIAIILSTDTSANFTNSSMKSMHDRTLKLVAYDFNIAIN